MRKALFLDRDGVINVDFGYVHRPDQVVFVDGIFELCRAARAHDYVTVVVTNQAGIARGLYTEHDFQTLTEWMRRRFDAEGAALDAVYHCPHHPEHGRGALQIQCSCRKPEPGLLLRAADDLSIDLGCSVMVGDKPSDLDAARRAGVKRRILLGHARPDDLPPDDSWAPTLTTVMQTLFVESVPWTALPESD